MWADCNLQYPCTIIKMKNLLFILLISILIISASIVNHKSCDSRENSIIDFCLNIESLEEVGNLMPSVGSPNSCESVFALLREGRSAFSDYENDDDGNYDGIVEDASVYIQQAHSIREPNPPPRTLSIQLPHQNQVRQDQYQAQYQSQSPYHQITLYQHRLNQFTMVQYPHVIQDPIVVPYFIPPPVRYIQQCQQHQHQQQQHQQYQQQQHQHHQQHQPRILNHAVFNLYRFNSNGKPGDFISQLETLNSLSHVIKSYDMFNNPSSYFLISNKYTNPLQVRDHLDTSLVFSISLNLHTLTKIIPAVQEFLWNYDKYLQGIFAIILDFKPTMEDTKIIFAFHHKYQIFAIELRDYISKFSQLSYIRDWLA